MPMGRGFPTDCKGISASDFLTRLLSIRFSGAAMRSGLGSAHIVSIRNFGVIRSVPSISFRTGRKSRKSGDRLPVMIGTNSVCGSIPRGDEKWDGRESSSVW
ncbi:MAG: hypothetical protein LKKZDAJK_002871 [Candidatus Fervidibacter sp.]